MDTETSEAFDRVADFAECQVAANIATHEHLSTIRTWLAALSEEVEFVGARLDQIEGG